MRFAVVGAGSVGLQLGGWLARAGHDVHFLVRRQAAARALRLGGVCLENPVTGEQQQVSAAATTRPDELPGGAGQELDALFFCTRAEDLESAARLLETRARQVPVVGAQNDVVGDAQLAAHFSQVLGLIVRQTCTRIGLDRVRSLGPGRLVLGVHCGDPRARDACERLARAFAEAGFDVGVSSRLAEDRWLKLCVNLMSAPNALVRRQDHARPGFVEVKARLLEEAREVLGRAGVTTSSCDGRDRSLDAEIRHQRESLSHGTSAREIPLYNQVWAALRNGGALEADAYHERILDLADRHAVAAPVNRLVLDALRSAAREGAGPECLSAEALLPAGSSL